MEVETGASERGGGIGERTGVGVRGRARGGGVTTEGVERGFDAETTFAATAFGGGFFGGGEGEEARVEERE